MNEPVIGETVSMIGRWVVGVFGVALGLYGLIWVVDAVAYLSGLGPQETVHIERTHTEVLPKPQGDPGEPPEFEPVKFGDGYYLSASGERHAISLPGDELKPGMTIHIRRPALAASVVWALHRSSQAVGALVFGLSGVAASCISLYAAVRDI